jgi:hypothetical protein
MLKILAVWNPTYLITRSAEDDATIKEKIGRII